MSHVPPNSAVQLLICSMLLVVVAARWWTTITARHHTPAHKATQRRVSSHRLHPGHTCSTASGDMT